MSKRSPRTSNPDSRFRSTPASRVISCSRSASTTRRNPGTDRFSAEELQHLHVPAVHHERAVDQPAHPAQRRGLQQLLRRPERPEPVGNDQLTFDVVYQKVLRTYYLLYPVMNFVFPLNSEADGGARAPRPSSDVDRSEAVDVECPSCRAPATCPPAAARSSRRGAGRSSRSVPKAPSGDHRSSSACLQPHDGRAGHHACQRTARAQPQPTAISIQLVAVTVARSPAPTRTVVVSVSISAGPSISCPDAMSSRR